jgi:hypothetical protein
LEERFPGVFWRRAGSLMKPEKRGGSPKGLQKHPLHSLDARANTRRLSQGLDLAECQRNRRTLWAVAHIPKGPARGFLGSPSDWRTPMPRPQAMEQRISGPSGGNRSIPQPERPGYSPGNRAAPQLRTMDTYRFSLKPGATTALSTLHTDIPTPPRTTRCYKRTTTTTRSQA